MVNEFNKGNLADIRKDVDAALAEVAKKHGLTSLSLGNIRFSSTEFSAQITARTGSTESLAKRHALFLKANGLPDDFFEKEIKWLGKTYKVTGINYRKPKNAIELLCVNSGKAAGASVVLIKQALGIKEEFKGTLTKVEQ